MRNIHKLLLTNLFLLLIGMTLVVSADSDVSIPAYSGDDTAEVNDNTPFDDLMSIPDGLSFSDLDELGRCGPASAIVHPETLATESRGNIGGIKPTGWQQNKYPGIVDSEPPFLYNRSHLIAFMFFGNITNDERNLITGTRHFNADVMQEYELKVVRYVESTGDSVRYRVTPVFEGDNLLAAGVLMEAESCTKGGLEFCVLCYNVQPGIGIDYATGKNWIDESQPISGKEEDNTKEVTYIANENSKKFHRPDCEAVSQMKEKNKKPLTCSRDEAIAEGWEPCGMCKP